MEQPDLHERIDHDFTLHSPIHPYIGTVMDELRAEARALAHLVVDRCPSGREQSMAITDLEHALQHAISGIARNQERVLQSAGIGVEPHSNS